MTEIIYYTESINKIISVFAIECSIVFAFIFLTLFCCTGKCFDSKKSNEKNNFIFKKYASQYKLPNKTLETLFKKDKKNEKNTNNSNTQQLKWFNWLFDMMNINKNEKLDKNVLENNKPNNKPKYVDLEVGLNEQKLIDDKTKILSDNKNLKNDNIEYKEDNHDEKIDNCENENVNNEIIDNKTILLETNQIKNLDNQKIYIVYEFNNLDKISKPSRYMESEELDEFDELEEFVNIIISSFKDKYEKIGVILKISSPGGSAFKFEHAYLNLLRLKDKKIELIGLVDKMAASGGYMLAMGCDKIICSKYAIIGSVGVIAQLYNWSELNKKVGLEEKTFTTGSHKNPFPMGSPYDQEDIERMGEMIDETFSVFKDIVFGGSRKFTQEQIEQITKAKTFHGFQAIQMGMVDQIQMSSEYLNKLDLDGHNIWICKKEIEQKSILNSLLFGNIKFLVGGIKNMLENNIVENKVNKIKLI